MVALCADEECFRHPELLGLEGENLLAQQWLMAVHVRRSGTCGVA